MGDDLVLQTPAYKTTRIGTEVVRLSTPSEWEVYGEILRRVEEARQWAIGDWLVDGKRHYGDGLYKKAAAILGTSEGDLRNMKSLSERFQLSVRTDSLSWRHHYEVASLKLIAEDAAGKLYLSDEIDYEKIEEMLGVAEKEQLSVRDLRERVRKHKEEQRRTIELANAPEKYNVIYADPPWQYTSGDQHTDEEQETVLGTHYDSMSIRELCEIPVKQISHENCVAFLWVTSPLLEEAFEIIHAWGFKYKTSMVWDKVGHNVGNYVSVRHEFLLICAKGTPPKVARLVDSVYVEERQEHSSKPEYFRELIDELYPAGKRIELFARGDIPEPWDSWGNESDKNFPDTEVSPEGDVVRVGIVMPLPIDKVTG